MSTVWSSYPLGERFRNGWVGEIERACEVWGLDSLCATKSCVSSGERPVRGVFGTNGSEFIGSWQAKNDSAFTNAIQRVASQIHRTIPLGQHRFQADVETVHNLMEQEFYEIESFNGRRSFLDKANHYQWFFNIARKNSAKENMTPWELAQLKHPNADPHLPLLSVEFLDELHDSVLHSSVRGYDVWALP